MEKKHKYRVWFTDNNGDSVTYTERHNAPINRLYNLLDSLKGAGETVTKFRDSITVKTWEGTKVYKQLDYTPA